MKRTTSSISFTLGEGYFEKNESRVNRFFLVPPKKKSQRISQPQNFQVKQEESDDVLIEEKVNIDISN